MPSVHTTLIRCFYRERIDLKAFLKVDQIENVLISYWCGRSKTHQNESTDKIAGACVCCMRLRTYDRTYNSVFFKRFSVNRRKRVKTVAWTRIERCVFDDNENAYFLRQGRA